MRYFDLMNYRPPSLLLPISLTCYVLAIAWLAYNYLNGRIDNNLFFNSDALYLPSLFRNIFLEGKQFSDWMLAPSSVLFPDGIFFSLAYILSKDATIQILVFAIIQSIVFFLCATALLSTFLRRIDAATYSALISSNAIFMGIYGTDPHGLSFISVFHFGSLLSYILLTLAFVEFNTAKSGPRKYKYGVFAFSISALSVFSDHLIILHFIAPTLIIGILYYLNKSKNKAVLYFSAILIGSTVLALALETTLLKNLGRLDYEVGFGSITNKSAILASWVANKPSLTQASLLLLPVSLIVSFAFLKASREITGRLAAKQELLAYSVLASTLTALLVTGLSNRDFTIRYLLPFIFLPPLFLFALISTKYSRYLSIAILLSSFLAFLKTPEVETNPEKSYHAVVDCIDRLTAKHNSPRGMAEYWDAIPINVFSKTGLNVVPVQADTAPTKWMYNTQDYIGKFSFAILSNDTSDMRHTIFRTSVIKRLAKKPLEYQCGNKTVLIFDNETLSLPQISALSNIQHSTLESFIKNPRALLIISQEEYNKGNFDNAMRLLSEAIALLKRSGASDDTILQYESAIEFNSPKDQPRTTP